MLNRIPLRFRLDPTESFEYSLHRVARLYGRSLQHAHLPYQCILEQLKLPSNTFLDIGFNYYIHHKDERITGTMKLCDAQLQRLHHPSEVSSRFDLCLTINHDEHANTIAYTLDGSCDLFDRTTVQDLSDRFHLLCQQLFSSSTTFDLKTQPIYELSLLLPAEKDILQQLNTSPRTREIKDRIHQAFAQQAMQHPEKTAITLDDQSLTYGQLLSRIQHLALSLIEGAGVRPGDIVCQCIDRSIDMVVGIMGIMMSGAVYAPLAPSDPFDRLDAIVRQVNAKLVLVHRPFPLHLRLLHLPVMDIDDLVHCNKPLTDSQREQLSRVAVTSDSISHIVFTSGSTGTPKAVQLRHRNFMAYMDAHFIREDDVILQLASTSFDVHLDEINGALVRGAHLVLLKVGGHLDLDYVTRVIHGSNVTFVAPVPSWMEALNRFLTENHHAQERVRKVRWWFLGGR